MSSGAISGLYRPGSASPLLAVGAHHKVLACVLFAAGVASTPRRSLWVFAIDAVFVVIALRVSGLSISDVARRLVVLLPVVVVAILLPFVAHGEDQVVVGFGVSLSSAGLWAAWNVLVKAFFGVVVSMVLTATTSVPDILAGLSKLKVPSVLVAIAAFMVRYLDLVVADISRVRVAMASRGYNPAWFWQIRPLATSAGSIFVRTFERSERVHASMLARGFTGVVPYPNYERSRWGWLVVIPGVLALALALGAVVR